MYRDRINYLIEAHRVLDNEISKLEKHGHYTDEQLTKLKKQRLTYKDEIAKLTRLQWEHDHETLDYDDDR